MYLCKKLLAFSLVLALVFSALSVTASAANYSTEVLTVCEIGKYAANSGNTDKLAKYVDLDDFSEYIFEELSECSSSIPIYSYNIPTKSELINEIMTLIRQEYGLFHVSCSSVAGVVNGELTEIHPTYYCTKQEYDVMYNKITRKSQSMVADIRDNKKLSDVEKALLLHDRIALNCKYDYVNYINESVPWESYSLYGVLGNGTAVCEGYAKTYSYLLDMVGIKSEICTSRRLCHAWNIVYIDGEKYHVDVTWDDPINGDIGYDLSGRVTHDNFLLSTSALKKGVNGCVGHEAEDYDSTPNSTKYDKYFWQKCDTAFYLLNNEIYYIDSEKGTLNRYKGNEKLLTIDDIWYNGEYSRWVGNFSKLVADGEKLYYSTSKNVYCYDPSNGSNKLLFSPSGLGKYESIFGLAYENNSFICYFNKSPNSETMKQTVYSLDKVAPTFTVASTNSVAATQTVTVKVSDDSSVYGYWWGKSSDYKKNKFTKVTSNNFTIKVSDSGTYYITVADSFDNISDTKNLVYRKATLNSEGGSVSPASLITLNGKSIQLPTPKKDGYSFIGWATSKKSKTGTKKITPVSDNKYYAIWKIKTGPMLIEKNGVLYYYNKGVKDNSNTLVKYNNKYYHVKGGKWLKDTTTVKYNNKLYYVKNGITQPKFTGYVKVSGKWIYVNKGIVTVEGIKLNKTSVSISKSKTYNLKASGFASPIKVKWTSNNKKIATVTQNGKVKGLKAGTAKITATFTYKGKTFKQTCTVKVKNK